MDPEHRHELKTNELADWIVHLPDFLRRNWAQIVGLALIIVALLVVPVFKQKRHNAAQARQAETTQLIQAISQGKTMAIRNQGTGVLDVQSQLLVTANSLEAAANKAKNPYSGALALIKRAEALRADLHYQSDSIEDSTIKAQISQARKAYERALEKSQGNNMLTGMARIGLGLCAEEVGNFDEAGRIYQEIVSDADFAGTIFPAQAQLRLERMDDNRSKFVFVSAPEPEFSPVEVELPPVSVDETVGEVIGPVIPQSAGVETVETETTPQESVAEAGSEAASSEAAGQTSQGESETD